MHTGSGYTIIGTQGSKTRTGFWDRSLCPLGYVYKYTRTCIFHIHLYTYIHTCIHACTCICPYVYIHTCCLHCSLSLSLDICIYIYTHVCAISVCAIGTSMYIYIYISYIHVYTYIYIYIYAYVSVYLFSNPSIELESWSELIMALQLLRDPSEDARVRSATPLEGAAQQARKPILSLQPMDYHSRGPVRMFPRRGAATLREN